MRSLLLCFHLDCCRALIASFYRDRPSGSYNVPVLAEANGDDDELLEGKYEVWQLHMDLPEPVIGTPFEELLSPRAE